MAVSVAVSHRLFLKRQKDAANITRRADLLDDMVDVAALIDSAAQATALPVRRDLEQSAEELSKLIDRVRELDAP